MACLPAYVDCYHAVFPSSTESFVSTGSGHFSWTFPSWTPKGDYLNVMKLSNIINLAVRVRVTIRVSIGVYHVCRSQWELFGSENVPENVLHFSELCHINST